ncbi:MAG TPA: 3-oxoacyl-ACP reductase family protein [Elusimicrobiota bacterium]|nr:3-oxoacyl-ACP reductase family protein [Elusimicrobiota bacterium]
MNVLVTGASRGIGERIARAFCKEGHRVLLNYHVDKERALRVRDALRAQGGEAEVCGGDVADPAAARALVKRTVELWGAIDGLVNNAGLCRDKTILKMTEEEWRRVLDVNLSGTFWCLKFAAEEMARKKSGFIINIASLLALRGGVGCANYAAAKAGVVGLTKSAARELGRFNVRVNAVLPGFHNTDMGAAAWAKNAEKILGEHVLGRLGDLDELGRFVVFLSQQQSVSGQIFNFESRVV